MRQQLELTSELKSDLLDTIDWGSRQLVDFDNEKYNTDSFDRLNNSGAVHVKMDGSVLNEKSSFKILGVSFSSKLNWGSYIVSIVKNAFKKCAALDFLFLALLFISVKLLCTYIKRDCIEYCHCVWAGCFSCCLDIWDKLQMLICRTIGPSLAATLDWSLSLLSKCSQVESFLYILL